MRGLVGRSISPAIVARYAAAIGAWLKDSRGVEHPRVVIGRDSRPSGAMYEHAAIAGLLSVGCTVRQVGILSTPGVAIMLQHLDADGGVVITASHNPAPWNGLKPLRHDGVAPPPEQARSIIEAFHEYSPVGNPGVGVNELQTVEPIDDAVSVHVDKVLALVDVELIRKAKLKAVVDSVQGAGGPEAAMLLDQFGVARVHLYEEPTGQFPHNPEPTRENLTELADAVAQHGGHVGFAQDPDADRLAIVDEKGQYIGEEYTLALCAMHLLGKPDTPRVAVANLSTSRMLDDIAEAAGATVIRTPVGEANVAAGMRNHGATVGGEGNGGIILNTVSQVRDSLIGMAVILEMLAERQQPLSNIVASTPSYAIQKDKIDIATLPGGASAVLDWAKRHYADQQLDDQDGVRVDWEDRWIHLRASNTEPILRVIAEASDEQAAAALIDEAKAGIDSL